MKRKVIAGILGGILILAAGALAYGYGVYHGYILLNNPSKSRYPVRGVDVSHYQGEIDWEILAQEDIQFAYIKATEGSGHVDVKFHQNRQDAEATKLRIGAYHFFSFDSPGLTQAANFIDTVAADPELLAPVVDVEYYADKKQNPPDEMAVRAELQVMLDELQAHYGHKPVIYSTEEVWEKYLKGHFDDYPLWIRNVMTKPRIDGSWTYWQYTNRARLKGYQGEETFIDVNVFSGNKREWEVFLNQ